MKRWRRWLMLAGILLVLSGCRGGIFGGGPWSSGDRVLVAKMLYDTGLVAPARYDVVVFKFPVTPVEDGTPRNYIKRLLGLPGEIIAILFGRLYRWGPGPEESPPFDDVNTVEANELWKESYMHVNSDKSRALFDAGKFDILRKPPAVQLAMRRIVYDNDFPAKDLQDFKDWARWQPMAGSGWRTEEPNGFALDSAKAKELDWVRYHHLLRPLERRGPIGGLNPPKRRLITDELGYNSVNNEPMMGNWVGDLMLECQVSATKADGAFWMELCRGVDRFRARFDLAGGQCTLYRQGVDGKSTELGSQPMGVRGPGTYDLRFANFDAQLTVWVNRELLFGDGKEYHPPEIRDRRNPLDKTLDRDELAKRCGPTANDLEPASFAAEGGAFQVRQLRLWRNTYYIQTSSGEGFPDKVRFLDTQNAPFDVDDEFWNYYRHLKPATLFVQPGHYLCLGDNSAMSSDGRTWGLVPERLMLGKAMMVYFPFSRAGFIR